MNIKRIKKLFNRLFGHKNVYYGVAMTFKKFDGDEGARHSYLCGHVFETSKEARRFFRHMEETNETYDPIEVIRYETSDPLTVVKVTYNTVVEIDEVDGHYVKVKKIVPYFTYVEK